LAVYVKPVTRLTPLYVALIDPFRRFIVYPAPSVRVAAGPTLEPTGSARSVGRPRTGAGPGEV